MSKPKRIVPELSAQQKELFAGIEKMDCDMQMVYLRMMKVGKKDKKIIKENKNV